MDVYDRQSVSAENANSEEYSKTLDDYDKFDAEMSAVNDEWQDCKRLIEAYNEQQVSLAGDVSIVTISTTTCLCWYVSIT